MLSSTRRLFLFIIFVFLTNNLFSVEYYLNKFNKNTVDYGYGSYSSASFSPDRKYIAGCSEHGVYIWDIETGKSENWLSSYDCKYISYNSNGDLIAISNMSGIIKIFDVKTKLLFKKLGDYYSSKVRSIAFSPNGKYLVSGSNDKIVRIWDIESEKLVKNLEGHSDIVLSVDFSPNGKYIASGSVDDSIIVWDAITGKMVRKIEDSNTVWSVKFNSTSDLLVSGGANRKVKIWNVNTGNLISTLQGHCHTVYSAKFSPDGRLVVSSSEDGQLIIWDALKGIALEGHYTGGPAFSVDFNSYGNMITVATLRSCLMLLKRKVNKDVKNRIILFQNKLNSIYKTSLDGLKNKPEYQYVNETRKLIRNLILKNDSGNTESFTKIVEVSLKLSHVLKNILSYKVNEDFDFKIIYFSLKNGSTRDLVLSMLSLLDLSTIEGQGYISGLLNPLIYEINPQLATLLKEKYGIPTEIKNVRSIEDYNLYVSKIFLYLQNGKKTNSENRYAKLSNYVSSLYRKSFLPLKNDEKKDLDQWLKNTPYNSLSEIEKEFSLFLHNRSGVKNIKEITRDEVVFDGFNLMSGHPVFLDERISKDDKKNIDIKNISNLEFGLISGSSSLLFNELSRNIGSEYLGLHWDNGDDLEIKWDFPGGIINGILDPVDVISDGSDSGWGFSAEVEVKIKIPVKDVEVEAKVKAEVHYNPKKEEPKTEPVKPKEENKGESIFTDDDICFTGRHIETNDSQNIEDVKCYDELEKCPNPVKFDPGRRVDNSDNDDFRYGVIDTCPKKQKFVGNPKFNPIYRSDNGYSKELIDVIKNHYYGKFK